MGTRLLGEDYGKGQEGGYTGARGVPVAHIREEAPQRPAEQNYVISRVDGARKRSLVGIEVPQYIR